MIAVGFPDGEVAGALVTIVTQLEPSGAALRYASCSLFMVTPLEYLFPLSRRGWRHSSRRSQVAGCGPFLLSYIGGRGSHEVGGFEWEGRS